VKLKNCKTVAPRGNNETEVEKLDVEIPSQLLKRGTESDESDRSDDEAISLLHRGVEDPEWTPGSSYLQKNLRDNNTMTISHIGYVLD